MKKILFRTNTEQLLADLHTPVGIYLQMRDHYPGSILLESTDFHAKEDSWSFIAIRPIAGIEVKNNRSVEYKYPLDPPEQHTLIANNFIEDLERFRKNFEPLNNTPIPCVQGLFGYLSFDCVEHIHQLTNKSQTEDFPIAFMRYRFYQYVIAINHFTDTLYLCEHQIEGLSSEINNIKTLLLNKHFIETPFMLHGVERKNMTDEVYKQMVRQGKEHCQRGNVFQIVLSRRYEQDFWGDEFNVYRRLRNINPSPYLFYFDYIDYKIFGSSPESQVIVQNKIATIHPIAGTIQRTGNDETDMQNTQQLLLNKKENAEHTMLVDLARNDLSIFCTNVNVSYLKQVKFYSHVIHLVSEVQGRIKEGTPLFSVLSQTFPAGTLSGAPKHKALQLIEALEPTKRNFYGGGIGFIGFDDTLNHAILIRSFLSKNNTLHYQAGAGIVIDSQEESEKKEVDNKLAALKKALQLSQD